MSAVGFPARYAGRCAGCNEPLVPGDSVAYNDDDVLVGQACCGGPGEVESDSGQAHAVMPRGRTVRDRCDRCFQIPSANGVCGCEQ